MRMPKKSLGAALLMLFAVFHLMGCESQLIGTEQRDAPATDAGTRGRLASLPTKSITTDSTQDFFGVQKQVYNQLFGSGYDQNYWSYSLDTRVDGSGVYAGRNQHGEELQLEVLVYGDIPLDTLNLTPAQQREASALDLRFGSAIAWISAGDARVAVSGSLFAAETSDLGLQSRFMVTAIEDETSVIFAGEPPAPTIADTSPLAARVAADLPDAQEPCEQACFDEYNRAVAAAQAEYQAASAAANGAYASALAAAATARETAIQRAVAAYDSSKRTADTILAVELVACHTALIAGIATCAVGTGWLAIFTAGVALGVCVAAVHIVYATCTGLAISAHSSAVGGAAQLRDDEIAQAIDRFTAAKNQAQNDRDNALRDAQAALRRALDAAQLALDACLDRCRRHVPRPAVPAAAETR